MTEETQDLVVKFLGRYISVKGPYIDYLGQQPHSIIRPEYIKNRIERDQGNGHHITLINPFEVAKRVESKAEEPLTDKQKKKLFRKELKEMYNLILETFGDGSDWEKPIDVGLGICKDGTSISYYRIVHWPFGQQIKAKLGLEHTNFHITVGFAPYDVHLYKGLGSLLCLQEDLDCDRSTITLLIEYTSFYSADQLFITSLYSTCHRKGYTEECARLVKDYAAKIKFTTT